jgi:hypothetical protein
MLFKNTEKSSVNNLSDRQIGLFSVMQAPATFVVAYLHTHDFIIEIKEYYNYTSNFSRGSRKLNMRNQI